ncbi:MAG: hypothetical protein FJ128_01370 [Deltaproteobacteria bacterium]|nr:hypothetical protein [Deltaproteobacteria bacterium]
MGAGTYPDEKVIQFIDKNFIPVQIESSNTALMDKYVVRWTPTLLVLDADGKEHYRAVGFFTPEDLIACLMTAKGRWYLDTEKFPEARAMFDEVVAAYPGSDAAAEAIFFNGVARYKESHDPKPLRQTYDLLAEKFPNHMWTRQAAHYKLINR